jgi:uncharacterized membrane protein
VAGNAQKKHTEWLGWAGMVAATLLAVVGIRRAIREDLTFGLSRALMWDAVMVGLAVVTFWMGLRFVLRSAMERRASPSTFLTPEEEERVVAEIEKFEGRTSGELRVHLEKRAGQDLMATAARTFERLGLTRTRERNGVLFFLAVDEHKFAVLGDEGIHTRVGQDFWNHVVEAVQTRLAAGQMADGLVEGIRLAGEALAQHFPPRPDDVNELPNTVSRG